jgi:AcrR family transcriptional regulator
VEKLDRSAGTIPEAGGDETQERILRGAARVFAEQGYARATTKALAAAAGVNEVTLFRRFGSKQGLFAAITERYAGPAISADLEMHLTGDYYQDLVAVGSQLLGMLLERKEVMRMMLCEAAHFPEVREVMAQNPRQIRLMLARYFERQIERGLVQPALPEVMAQAFMGMFFSYAIGLAMLGEVPEPELAAEELAVKFVDMFVHGTWVRG